MKALQNIMVPLLIAATVATGLMLSIERWNPVERILYDLRMRIHERIAHRDPSVGSVVVVGIEEEITIADKPLVFWYPEMGRFISMVSQAGARSIGIDIIPVHSLGEKIIASAISVLGEERVQENVSLFQELGEASDNSLISPLLMLPDTTAVIMATGPGVVPFFYPYIPFMPSVEEASVVLTPDPDTTIRKQNLVFREGDAPVESFAYRVYRTAGGDEISEESVLLDYALHDQIQYYSFNAILNGTVNTEALRDKIVLLGYISGYDDTHMTPFEKRLDGVVIHGITVETLLSGSWLRPLDTGFEYAIIVALSFAGLVIAMRFNPLRSLVLNAALAVMVTILNVFLFTHNTYAMLVPSVLAAPLVFTFIYPFLFYREGRIKSKLYRTFCYYMDRNVIDSLIQKDARSLLRGEEKNVCVMVLDIRGFTAMTRQHDPEWIVNFLNTFFDRASSQILMHKGCLDKFIGDSILAFFPSYDTAVADAVRAAQGILKAVEEMNASNWGADDQWRIRIGIGIDYGSVIIGNIGSEKKMDFTIIGETVNIASRIEAATKELGKPILISHRCASLLPEDEFKKEHLGGYKLRGYDELFDIYTVI